MKIYNIFFSPTGNTRKIANYFSENLNTQDINLSVLNNRDNLSIDKKSISIISIPTYAQNIPLPIRKCLKDIKSEYVLINITFGGMSYGNLVYDTKKMIPNSICIGYSVTPVTHCYINKEVSVDYSRYDSLINRIKDNILNEVKIPYKQKNIFANFLEKNRIIFNYRISYDSNKCNECNKCINHCPVQAIDKYYNISCNCIRCGNCVINCPTNALTAKQSLPLRIYLNTKKAKTNVIIR